MLVRILFSHQSLVWEALLPTFQTVMCLAVHYFCSDSCFQGKLNTFDHTYSKTKTKNQQTDHNKIVLFKLQIPDYSTRMNSFKQKWNHILASKNVLYCTYFSLFIFLAFSNVLIVGGKETET